MKIFGYRAWVLGGLALLAGAGCLAPAGGFDDHTELAETTLIGSAVRSAAPVEGAIVALRLEDGTVLRATTGTGGAFSFAPLPAGAVKLVLRDGQGMGALRVLVLQASGTNDTGPIELVPLSSIAELVDIPGLGLPERVSQLPQDCLDAQFASDGSAVYCRRISPDSDDQKIVKIELPSGAEQVLVGGLHPVVAPGDLGVAQIGLIGDRVLAFRGFVDDISSSELDGGRLIAFFDAEDGHALGFRAANETKAALFGPSFYRDAIVAQGALYYLRDGSGVLQIPSLDARIVPVMVRHDLASGEDRTLSLGQGEGEWIYSFEQYLSSDTHLVYQLRPNCGSELQNYCPGPVKALDLVSLSTSTLPISSVNGFSVFDHSTMALRHDQLMYKARNRGVPNELRMDDLEHDLMVHDLSTGSTQVLLDHPCVEGCSLALLAADGTGRRIAYALRSNSAPAASGHVLDRENGASSALQSEFVLSEGPQSVFLGGSDFFAVSLANDGALRVVEEGGRYDLVVDYPAGAAPALRVFPYRQDLGENVENGVSTLTRSADGRREAISVFDPQSGFATLHEGVAGSELSGLAVRSFLPSHHQTLHYAADGAWLYFTARDPLSGWIQIFRLDTAEP